MKTLALALLLGALPTMKLHSFFGHPSEAVTTPGKAKFHWVQTTYDFGKITRNKPVTHKFEFANNGTDALIISGVQASCGCTVANYSKDPIVPGSNGFVTATYNAANPGVFSKTITVNSNTEDGVVLLTIKGEVTE